MVKAGIALFFILLAFEVRLGASEINRGSFPNGFVFGTASSSYQYEGAVKEGGRGMTIWDTFAHKFGKISDFSNADVAVDQYHRYPEDVQLMKDMGMDAYRFSIAWSRIFPNGTGQLNQAGVDHYNNLINALLAKGIEPYVTLYHWDLPQALHDRYLGWLDRQIINDYTIYAETCFQKFGDRVKHWITFNEPHTFAIQGYAVGFQAPGRCSILSHILCREGNSSSEPYIVGHNVLLSHAAAVDIYRKKYKAKQGGSVGISFDVIWFEPATNSTKDIEATQRAQDFQLGWFLDPLMFGEYPNSMRDKLGTRLPTFSSAEASLLKGSLDFVGINHYTTFYARDNSTSVIGPIVNAFTESGTVTLPFKGTKAIGDRANSIWLYIVPGGLRSLMNYIKQKYGNPTVIITENGMDDPNSIFISLKDALKDAKRIKYHNDYLTSLLAAIKEDGCNVKGYFAWSLLDNWEWSVGFSSRFGLYFVDYKNNQTRHAKDSVQWFKNFLTSTRKKLQT
uniref:Beta-glucosidase n=1 Tax=Kalanchoe fedtschenkoi TaxID=63787 RepID=A0A7N0UDD7_KALFE